MKRFKNILVVIDGATPNEAVVERAVILAQENRARLTVVDTVAELPRQVVKPVTPEPPAEAEEPLIDIIEEWPSDEAPPVRPDPSATLPSPPGEWPAEDQLPVSKLAVEIQEHIIEEESRRLEQWVDFIRQGGVQVSGKVLYGTPFLQIIRDVLRNEHDLVMTTAEGGGALREKLFGSTTMNLMRKCPCPVWVVKPTQPERYSRILAAVDPSPPDEERQALNIQIMDLATALARLEQSELIVVHAWVFANESSLRNRVDRVPAATVDEWVRVAQDRHRAGFAELLKPYELENLNSQVYMLKGRAGRVIPELAKKSDVELIVMGTVSRTGVAGLFIGNTAEKILRHVDCSVLTVKPDGFVTPVKLDK